MTNRSEEFVRLKEISGWTQARIARELDLDPSTVSLVMNHRCQPSLTVLRLFSLLIGERLQLPGESDGASYIRDRARWLEDWESDLIAHFRRLDPASRSVAAKAVGTMIEAIMRPTKYRIPQRPDPVTAIADEITASAIESITAGRVTVLGAGASAPIAEPRPETASAPPTPRRRAPESRPVSRTASKPDPKHSRLAS